MADEKTVSFLKKHGLHRLVPVFQREKLLLTDFNYLRNNPSELHILLPAMRDRIDFTRAVIETNTKKIQADMDPRIVPRESLTEIFKKSIDGKKFLDAYKIIDGKREYPPDSRKILRKVLVEYFFVLTKGHISNQHFLEMVQIITDELPDEDPRTWYTPAGKKNGKMAKSASGFLYNTYRYLQQTDKRYKTTSQPDENEAGTSDSNTQLAWEELNAEQKTNCVAAKNKLKVTSYSDSCTITASWKQSFALRRHEAVTGQIKFNDWEVLSHFENIYELVNYDFQTVHSVANDTLTLHSPKFVQNFKKVFEGYRNSVEEDIELCRAIDETFGKESLVTDTTIFLSFYALPLIIRQQFAAKDKKRVKLSTYACRSAYITLVETEAKIMETVHGKRHAACGSKSTVQPYIIAVGTVRHISGFYVILDELMFKCQSMIAAVDLHFKLHTVFHLEYAKECESVLQFIQIHFYDLSYAGERIDSNATAFASDCKRM